MDEESLFSISTEPEEGVSETILYDKNSSILLGEGEEKHQSRAVFRCFNCGAPEHTSNDCPEEFDPVQSRKNRIAFNNSRQQKMGANKAFQRYHLVIDCAEKEEAAPGVISDKLREALGITRAQLPPFIYRMRTLGYPPGWLEEAVTSPSSINMLDSNGERVPNTGDEDGEILLPVTRYDFTKIIDFPGFNIWPSPETINETSKYGAPEMDYSHSKIALIDFYKKRMEAEERDLLNHPTRGQPVYEETRGGVTAEPRRSEVEEEEEEGEITSKKSLKRKSSKKVDEKTAEKKTPRKSLEQESVHETTHEELNESISNDLYTPNQTLDSSFGRVITVELGTPAVKMHSPFSQLPSSEAFRKDISDVINFENLPNTTGNYDKLKGVLKTVREKLNVFKSNTGN